MNKIDLLPLEEKKTERGNKLDAILFRNGKKVRSTINQYFKIEEGDTTHDPIDENELIGNGYKSN